MPRPVLLLVTDLEIGGTPTVVREIATRLHRRGVSVHVACLSKWGPTADAIRDAGVAVTALNAGSVADVMVVRRLIRLIRSADVGTVLSFLVHANVISAAASVFVDGVRWLQSIQTTQPNPRWHWVAQKWAAKRAEVVFVPSESVVTAARQWSEIPAEKMVVIPNAIEPAEWDRSAVPTDDPKPYPIAFVGRLDPIKDVPTLIRAMQLLTEPGRVAPVFLNIYGDGPDRQRIEHEIDRLGLRDVIRMHGSIAKPQAAMQATGLLVLPSLAEGFGLVLIEAMAAGVPVVATNVPGIRDVVENERTGLLVPPADPAALAAAIRRVVTDLPLRRSLIETADAMMVARMFTWESTIDCYRRLLRV